MDVISLKCTIILNEECCGLYSTPILVLTCHKKDSAFGSLSLYDAHTNSDDRCGSGRNRQGMRGDNLRIVSRRFEHKRTIHGFGFTDLVAEIITPTLSTIIKVPNKRG